jgi:hypothetical protein
MVLWRKRFVTTSHPDLKTKVTINGNYQHRQREKKI